MQSIEIKKNKHLKLTVPEFLCDHNPIGEHLNKYDMLSHFNKYCFNAFIGKPGSGKTSLLVSMLAGKGKNKVFRKCFNHVLVVMPSTSRESMKHNIFKDHHEDKMYEEFNYSSVQDILNKLTSASEENENSLLILDDVGASLKNKDIQRLFRQIIYNRRHLKCQIVMLIQSYLSCPREIRKLLNNIVMFKCSKVENENLFAELFEIHKDLALEIMNVAYQDPHDYLMLNVDTQKIYRKFDEIIIKKNLE